MNSPTLQTRNRYSSLSVDPIPPSNLNSSTPRVNPPSTNTPRVQISKGKATVHSVPAKPPSPSIGSSDNGSSKPKKTEEESRYAAPFSALWTLRRVRAETPASVGVLRNWVHKKRRQEATYDAVKEIASMEESTALLALHELAAPKKYIRGHRGGRQMDITMTLSTLDDERDFRVDALLDSGCTGSSIDAGFVERNKINVRKLPRPIPVYNADGSLNKGGPIAEYVDLRVKIQDHVERMSFAVTNLGKTDVFIGYEWLELHNPSIDWQKKSLTFDRCPDECAYDIHWSNVEDEEAEAYDEEAQPEEGDRIFLMDYVSYLGLDKAHIRAKGTKSQELAEKHQSEQTKKSFKDIVPKHYHDYADVFAKKEFDTLPGRRPWDHAIELVPGSKPIDCKVYPLSPEEQKKLDDFLEENLRSGRIRPSKSPMASPFFFVKKKDGSLRPVQDYRKLNNMTVKNRYPLPLIQELVGKLKGAKYFTKLDVRWGYNNVRIKEGDEWKAAFRTNRGLFEPLVMFFGLTNSPATFQTMMNDLFHDLISRGVVVVYLDDIMIYTRTLEEHRKVVREVLDILRKNKLYLKPEKCEFEVTQTEYLGMIISEGHVGMDPVKVKGISEWPVPKCKRDVQAFLGFTNFYRRFIKDYGRIAKPLTGLTGNAEWTWGVEQQMAFEHLKKNITTSPTLVIPTDEDPYRVECDASDFAIGAVLSQKQEGKWHPVAYLSKAMNATERNYEIYDKELLAIMTSLDEWRHYLMGARHEFEIFTDHKNLEYFRKPQKLNRRQARWVTELADYHFTLHHKPGALHQKPDLLSRRADHERGANDNTNVVLLKPEWFRAHEIAIDHNDDIIRRIKRSRGNKDRIVIKALAENEPGWAEDADGIVTWQGRIYVPKDKPLREQIIKMNHDSVVAGHPGQYKTHELITRDYWWPRIRADVRQYVAGCEICQRTKPHRTRPAAPLQPNEVAKRPWEIVSVDMIGPLPESSGYDAILNIVDMFSKQLISIPTNLELTSSGWVRIYRDRVFVHHGWPRKIISDRGPQFVSKFVKELYAAVGIEGNPSTAYHPQTDGQTERVNQEIEQYLRIFVNHHQSDWSEWLAMAAFSYNNKVHTSTGYSPFYLNKGFHPNSGTNVPREFKNETVEEFVERMKKLREEAESSLKAAQEMMKRYYDRKRSDSKKYKVGDKVWLEGYHIHTDRPMKKLDDKRYGPFKILEKIGKSSYKLALPKTWKALHPVFNEVVLSPYTPPTFPSQQKPAPPAPEIVDGEKEYVVEEIMDSKMDRGTLKYLVKWKGYPREEWTWEPPRNLENAKAAITKFHRTHPNAPRPRPRQLRFQKLENYTIPAHVPARLYNWEQGVFERAERISRGRDP